VAQDRRIGRGRPATISEGGRGVRRIAELDALRGLAALAILVFHLDPAAFPFGWTGVDLFFVLSGYLITAIILRHRAEPGFLPTFYVRRGLRIWPIYYLTLGVLVAINPWLPRPYRLDALPYYLLYLQNTPMYRGETVPAFNQAFEHTWTLALEEQFYMIWPALLLLVPRGWIARACLATAGLSIVARHGFEWYFVFPIQVLPFMERLLLARADGFALGGLLAVVFGAGGWFDREPMRVRRALLAGLAVSTAYLLVGWIRGGVGFIGLPTPRDPALTIFAVEVFYTSLVGLVLCHLGSPLLAPLRWKPLCYLGLISYGVYMYHSPLYWAIDGYGMSGHAWVYDQPWTTKAGKVALSLAVAIASWHLIEKPVLRLKDRFAYGRRTASNPEVEEPAHKDRRGDVADPAEQANRLQPDGQQPGLPRDHEPEPGQHDAQPREEWPEDHGEFEEVEDPELTPGPPGEGRARGDRDGDEG
jgi:peptidoglycan/LPS O-acetylase OafA/YrhL